MGVGQIHYIIERLSCLDIMGLFKSKEERAYIKYNKGSDLIAQKQYSGALNNFNKIISLGQATPDVFVLQRMLEMRSDYTNPEQLSKTIDVLSQYPGLVVKYGVYDVSVDEMLHECQLRLKGQQALAIDRATKESALQIVGAASELAAYDRTFILDEIFAEKKITARDYSNKLYALGYETMSEAIKWDDPKKAAEYQQQALIYNNERHDIDAVNRNQDFIRGASITVHCWFCGREVSGENIHFVPMESNLTDPILKQADPSKPLATNSDKCVYACRACFSTFDNLAKKYLNIAKEYTDQETNRVYNILMSEIRSLQSQINSLRVR